MLSNIDIKGEIEKGNIVISPFNERQLGTNSYDVRLGRYYYYQNPEARVLIPAIKESVEFFWLGPERASLRIIIEPGQTILAHTEEIIGGRNRIVASMRARSSIGRSCLSVCKCAGIGDVGYISRWTMEISNHSTVPIYLPVGLRVAQITFDYTGPVEKEYSGKYGQGDWTPSDMLPKLYLDTDYWEEKDTGDEFEHYVK